MPEMLRVKVAVVWNSGESVIIKIIEVALSRLQFNLGNHYDAIEETGEKFTLMWDEHDTCNFNIFAHLPVSKYMDITTKKATNQ